MICGLPPEAGPAYNIAYRFGKGKSALNRVFASALAIAIRVLLS
jgi:hypothetical protein